MPDRRARCRRSRARAPPTSVATDARACAFFQRLFPCCDKNDSALVSGHVAQLAEVSRFMRFAKILVGCWLVAPLLTPGPLLAAESALNSSSPSFASQAVGSDGKVLPGGQPGEPRTLEIAPQPSDKSQSPAVSEIPVDRAFRPHDDIAALNRNFHPRQPDGSRAPYTGMSVEYTTQCYLGMEEHGFEVMSIYPESPAAKAGLQGKTPVKAIGAVGAVASAMLGPVAMVAMPLLKRSGAMGSEGDLIVAIDDQRVRSGAEWVKALGKLRPGDTTYFTVIRPLPGGAHQTMRIAVHLDKEGETNQPPPSAPVASAPAGSGSPNPPLIGSESAAD
jgi:PDZ domain